MTSNISIKKGRPQGSNNKNVNLWTDIHQNTYEALYNRFVKTHKDAKHDTYIEDNKEMLNIFIDNQDLSQSRKKDLFFTVGRWLLIHDDEPTGKIYSQSGYDLMQDIREKETEGLQSEKELNYYMDLDIIKYVMTTDKFKKLAKSNEDMPYFLLLYILTLQPVLRANFYETCRIITDIKDNDDINNFLLITNNKMQFIVNNDKISKHKNNIVFIDIEDTSLQRIIRKSFNNDPREYLFEDEYGEPFTYFKLTSLLRKALDNPGITLSMIRSAYINDFYSKHDSVKDREALARKMRHGFLVALIHYNKLALSKHQNTPEEIINKAELEINRISEINQKNKITPEEQAYKKLKSNTLLKLNQRGGIPRQTTIDKYNLFYDKELKQWF